MGIKFDKDKTTDRFNSALKKSADIGKAAVAGAQKNRNALIGKTKNDLYLRRIKKYNPLFPEQFVSPEFYIPNMIRIVDDAVRRGIDACGGSNGWLSTENGIEALQYFFR